MKSRIDFLSRQKHKPLTKLQQKRICLFFTRSSAHLTRRRAFKTMIIFFFKRLKSLLVYAKFLRNQFDRTRHVPNKCNYAIIIPTTRDWCATHRKNSQLINTCLQRNIGSCRGGELRDG